MDYHIYRKTHKTTTEEQIQQTKKQLLIHVAQLYKVYSRTVS